MDTLSYLGNFTEIMIFLIAFIVLFIALTKMNLGTNKTVIAILSLIIALMLISSKSNSTIYLSNLIPLFTLLIIILLFTLLTITFVAKDLGNFNKILSWSGFIVILLIISITAFMTFPVLYHLLPNTSNANLDPFLIDLKNLIYKKESLQNLVFWISGIIVFFIITKK